VRIAAEAVELKGVGLEAKQFWTEELKPLLIVKYSFK
jgi:hypothetical protein